MNERILQKRLKRLGIAVAVISAAILAAGSLASFYLRNILGEALTGQMKSDADQYRTNILRQMDADLQTLDTLGSLLQYRQKRSCHPAVTGGTQQGVHSSGYLGDTETVSCHDGYLTLPAAGLRW